MSHRTATTGALLVLNAFGVLSIGGLLFLNGWMDMKDDLIAQSEPMLPGAGGPARTYFTGSAALDEALTGILKFFYPCVSGEMPALHRGTMLAFPVIWGMTYQSIPFGIILPLYAIAYIWLSPLAKPTEPGTSRAANQLPTDLARLQTTASAMLLGFALPSVLPALPSPSIISRDSQQIFLALWQVFPIWVSLSHWFLAAAARTFGFVAGPTHVSPTASLQSLRHVYRTTLKYTSLAHFGVLALATFPQLRPVVYNGGLLQERVSLWDIFVPPSALMAEGSLTLLQYDLYCACAAMAILVSYLAYTVGGLNRAAGLSTIGGLLRRSVVVAPGGAVLWALWDRDEEVLAGGK
ncbi:Citreoviridin biosynthesis protein D like [Verticillium longisporum]|nr:Citreoviridin biosynthesis protein D like [Verticillium longisporum]